MTVLPLIGSVIMGRQPIAWGEVAQVPRGLTITTIAIAVSCPGR